MTVNYEVKTKHTKEVLYDFVKFSNTVRYPKTTAKLLLMAVCMLLCFILSFNVKHPIKYVFLGIFIFLTAFAFLRHYIGFFKIMAVDENFKNDTPIDYQFGEKKFNITRGGVDDYKDGDVYGAISFMYFDKKNYYISIDNEEIHILPFRNFTIGNPSEFREFIEHRVGKEMYPVTVPFKQRVEEIKVQQAMADAKRQADWDARKAEKKAKKKK
ncbi:MAG: YcxB family protein [Lachnospiraceae bacterium]|jgi:hypothetical protein|nr:YcxB family protein [Lachnospiraceae bacterium]